MKKLYSSLLITFVLLLLIGFFCIQFVEKTPYQKLPHYSLLIDKFDSLANHFPKLNISDQFTVGIAKSSITPEEIMPLAGYGKRSPKQMEGILDSSFVTSIVYHNGFDSVAFLSSDLLIIHPNLTRTFFEKAALLGWDHHRLHLSATHTHSGIGGWAPGFIGESFAGKFNPSTIDWLAEKMIASLEIANANKNKASIAFFEIDAPDYVRNRLVDQRGMVDSWLKVMQLHTASGIIYHTIYSSHATCFSHKNHLLSSDYPAFLIKNLEKEAAVHAAVFSAGAVGSMRPESTQEKELERAQDIGNGLSEQINMISLLNFPQQQYLAFRFFRLEIPLNRPQFKISKNLCLRPWLFNWLVGQQRVEISYAQLNDVLWIGIPADFSGELALPLYEYARSKGLNLIITSFSGSYIGYIPKDDWYDLDKYETRTMSWYGHDNGAYFSEITKKLIDLSTND